MQIIQLDGGLGRVLCAEPAVSELAKKDRIILITGYPQIFWHNPNVYKIYTFDHPYLWDDVISLGDFWNPEPYHNSNYYKQKHHLIESFCHLLGCKPLKQLPKIYLTMEEIAWGMQTANHIKQKIGVNKLCAFHPYGATATEKDGNISDPTIRSLPESAVSHICSHFKQTSHLGFVNCSSIPVEHDNVWNQLYTNRELFSIIHVSDFILSIDSCTMHIAAAMGKKGTCLLGSTYHQNVGYDQFNTIQRDNYPKNYVANRFTGGFNWNEGAFDYNSEELENIIKSVESFI